MTELKKETPYNYDAEVYVLGSVFLDPNLVATLHGKLVTSDFHLNDHKKLYQAILSLYQKQIQVEPISVIEECERLKLTFEYSLKELIMNLIDTVPSTASVGLYIDIIKEKAVSRELLNQMTEITNDIYTNRLDFNDLLDKTENTISQIIKKRRSSEILTIAQAADTVYQQIESYTNTKAIKGLKTGFPGFDQVTLGLQKGELIILAARPSVGKSAFALNLAVNVSKNNIDPQAKTNAHVAFFSLEMSIEQLMMRLYSYESYISMSKIQSAKLEAQEMIRLGHARKQLSEYNIYFDESNSAKIYDIRTKCRQLKQAQTLDLIIIDYLQLVTGEKSTSRQEEVASISRSLKVLAKELDVPVVALSQLSRLVETREDKRPVLSDLRESGSIEQDADVVMFLHRVDDTNDDKFEVIEKVVPVASFGFDTSVKKIELTIAKNRQGALRNLSFNFLPAECRFREETYAPTKIRVPIDPNKEKKSENY